MFCDNRLACANNHLDVSRLATVHNVFLRQQVGGGNDHSSQFVQGHDAEPEFVTSFQYKHHHITFADAERLEVRGRLVAVSFDICKSKLPVLLLVVCPKQGRFIRLGACPFVYNVIAEIEMLGHIDVEVLFEILL